MADCHGGKDSGFASILVAIRSYFNEAKAPSGILRIIKGASGRAGKSVSSAVPEEGPRLPPLAGLEVSK